MRQMPSLDTTTSEQIPACLRERPQWVMWRRVARGDGKPTKVPFMPNGAAASHSKPATWSSFDACVAALALDRFDGIGFVFSADDPFCGMDLDGCYMPDGTLKSWAFDLVSAAAEAEAYIERTPSGLGLHIIGCATIGAGRKRAFDDGAIEIYDRDRYFTVSGEQTEIGDAKANVSSIVALARRQFGLTDEAVAKPITIGVEVQDYEADKFAAAVQATASREFHSFWADKIEVGAHGNDRSAHRISLLNKLAMRLWTVLGREPTGAELRAVALRAPFIKNEMSHRRGKWPRLAAVECGKAIVWARENRVEDAPAPPAAGLLLTIGELAARAASLSWAVKHVIPEASLGMLFGASGAFKSFLALDYALHRAYGLAWMGRRTKPGRPVYLAAEGGAGLFRRIQAWHQARGLDWQRCPMLTCTVPLTLASQASTLRDAVRASAPDATDIIVDTLSQTYTGNENAADEMAGYFRKLGAELREALGATVLIVHHSGHAASERPRGSSAITANLDFVLGAFRDEKEMLATLTVVKQKDGDRIADQPFSLTAQTLGMDEDGEPITSLAAKHLGSGEEIAAKLIEEKAAGRSSHLNALLEVAEDGMVEAELRREFYRTLRAEMSQESRQKAFVRARDRAVQGGFLVIDEAAGRLVRMMLPVDNSGVST